MESSPSQSFFKFLFVFLLFISISFGVTFAVNEYTVRQVAAANQASALRALLGTQEEHYWYAFLFR